MPKPIYTVRFINDRWVLRFSGHKVAQQAYCRQVILGAMRQHEQETEQ